MQYLFHQRTLHQDSAFLICTPLIYIQFTTYDLRESYNILQQQHTIPYLVTNKANKFQGKNRQWCFKAKKAVFRLHLHFKQHIYADELFSEPSS